MSTSQRSYHHGDLRAALVSSAVEMLEADEPYSMRAVARRAGVSPTAPYRHFADRTALDSAVAVEGFRDLTACLEAADDPMAVDEDPVEVLSRLCVVYVSFALRRPALFRLMFGNDRDDSASDRVQASQALHAVLGDVLARVLPGEATPSLSTALWGLAHGLAFLHLDGKYHPEPSDEVAGRVRAAVVAVLSVDRGPDRTARRRSEAHSRPPC